MDEILILSYKCWTIKFTRKSLPDDVKRVTAMVGTDGFTWGDAAQVHRLMRDIAWQPSNHTMQHFYFRVKCTRWSTGTTITRVESRFTHCKFTSMRDISAKWSESFDERWDIDVSVIDAEPAQAILKQMESLQ